MSWRLGLVVVAVGLVAALAPPALATPRVLVFTLEEQSVRAGFVEALTIQLAGEAIVEPGLALPGTSLARRLERAVEEITARGGEIGVWIELVDAPTEVLVRRFDLVLYAVGGKPDTALVNIARITIAHGEDIDRALALKVAEFLDGVLAAQGKLVEAALARPAVVTPAVVTPVPTRRESSQLRGFLALGGAAFAGGPAQGELAVDAGLQVRRTRMFGEVGLALGLPGDLDRTVGDSTMSIREVRGGVIARALVELSSVTVGGGASAGLRRFEVLGIAGDGVIGRAVRWVPYTGLEAELRLWLSATSAVRASVGVDVALEDQQFTIDRMPVIQLRQVRGVGQVSFVITLP